MKYRFSCPSCGHGQESSFVRLGAVVECPRCEEVFPIEAETLEGGGAAGLGVRAGRSPAGDGAEPATPGVLGGEEPEALVGLSGLSGLMHEAEGGQATEKGEARGESEGFPGATPGAGSFRGSAESGVGVDAAAGGALDDEDQSPAAPPHPRAAAAAVRPPAAPPPTRDELRRQRARERADAAERTRRRRRMTLIAALAVGLAIGFLAGLVALLSGSPAPPDPEEAASGSPAAATGPSPPVTAPPEVSRVVYAHSATGGAPEPRPGVRAEAEAVEDPLGQTRRLKVTLTATDEPVPGPIRLHLRAAAPGEPAWSVDWPGGLEPGDTQRLTVALVPPLPTRGQDWSATVSR